MDKKIINTLTRHVHGMYKVVVIGGVFNYLRGCP